MIDSIAICDELEKKLLKRVEGIYANALKTALKRQKSFLNKIKAVDAGRIQPPLHYVLTGTVDKWREGFVREAMRQQQVVDGIMSVLNRAGGQVSALIQNEMVDVYRFNRQESIEMMTEAGGLQLARSFAMPARREIKEILLAQQGPFSKLAYNNLGKNVAVRTLLQDELAQATALGEGQDKLIARIRKVTGQSYKQAKRVAQTERTRVQSAARNDALAEAQSLGLVTTKEWRCKFSNSRDSHMALHGTVVYGDAEFVTKDGWHLAYPGDPRAPAK